ncbi:MAG: hypothetical protein ACP5MG_10045 [Verrucomicrobiia bacterium]|jgi:hypothetical protein
MHNTLFGDIRFAIIFLKAMESGCALMECGGNATALECCGKAME